MASMDVRVRWAGDIHFESVQDAGPTLHIGGDDGFKPTALLLYGVAGCTGIDIVRILEKKRQKLSSLEITVHAEQNDDYPKPFHTVRVHYVARGEGLSEKALAQAIELSESKYCVVSQTLQQPATVSTSFEIAG